MSSPGRPFERSAMTAALADAADAGQPFDLVVVGGGITGCGVALDAAARGLRTALVERDDFASGTSSKSSKMVHGGLRYLQNGDVRLVRQALRERHRLTRNAPHLVDVLPFLIPIMTRDGVVSKKIAKALRPAMWMYDLSGGWRIGKLHRRVDAATAARHFPTTHLERLSGGFVYYDAGADDARLTLAIARTAAAHGAVVANRCPLLGVHRDGTGTLDGVVVDIDGTSVTVPTRAVVNATGVWADTVRAMDEGDDPGSIRPAKGVHVSLPWELVRVDIAVIIPVRSDKRSLFIVPWGPRSDGTFEHVYVGTTDTDTGDSLDDPSCDGDDIDYILTALNEALTTTITQDDITGTWAGLRPLVAGIAPDGAPIDPSAKTADLSRRHRVDVAASGVITVTGGKLTTYREMAEDAVDAVVELLGRRRRRAPTRRLRLTGAMRPSPDDRLGRRYGTAADEVRALVALDPALGDELVPGLPYLRAEAVYAVRAEMATTLDDVLTRRTRAHLFDRRATLDAAPDVARLIADELGWDDGEVERQVADYRARCSRERDAESRRTASATHGSAEAPVITEDPHADVTHATD